MLADVAKTSCSVTKKGKNCNAKVLLETTRYTHIYDRYIDAVDTDVVF